MTYTMKRFIRATDYRMSDRELDKLKKSMKVSNEKSGVITAGSAIWFQFIAHDTYDTDGDLNHYSGVLDGKNGFLPDRRMKPFLMKDGFVVLEDGHFPSLPVAHEDGKTEIGPDFHRLNENPALKAIHLWFAKLYNKRMAKHGDPVKAFDEAMCMVTRVTINEACLHSNMDERELMDVRVRDFNLSIEAPRAAFRHPHRQMPETTNGKPIFRREFSSDVDLIKLFDGSEMASKLDAGIPKAMTEMHHTGPEPDIREHTISERHGTEAMPSFNDFAAKWRIKSEMPAGTPFWYGMLKEAENQGDGYLGSVGRRVFADIIAGMVQGQKFRTDNAWKNAPTETVDIIAEAYAK